MKRSIARHTGSFGNWRAKFKAEPQPPVRKLLYRRRGLSHTLTARILAPLTRSPRSGRLGMTKGLRAYVCFGPILSVT